MQWYYLMLQLNNDRMEKMIVTIVPLVYHISKNEIINSSYRAYFNS